MKCPNCNGSIHHKADFEKYAATLKEAKETLKNLPYKRCASILKTGYSGRLTFLVLAYK